MKKTKIIAAIGGLGLAALSVFLIAADHVDSPSVTGKTGDIADVYAFQGEDVNSTVLIATLQGPIIPSETASKEFDENVVVQFKIDNASGTANDFVEDLVIQAVRRGDSMYFFGPTAPASTGLSNSIVTSATRTAVKISGATGTANVATGSNGMKVYAGPRRDMFFFDFNQFNKVKQGPNVAPNGFLQAGAASDFFENLNVLAVVVEVPNSLLGDAVPHVANGVGAIPNDLLPDVYNVWATTNRKQ